MLYRVIEFATEAHKGQVRKYTGEGYIRHPIEVAVILYTNYSYATFEMLAAAILHDTVEDTDVTIEDIHSKFGDEVGNLVAWLTDVSKPTDGNRAARKQLDREHTLASPHDAQIIKVADLISNSQSIAAHDKDFAKVYMAEKKLLLLGMLHSVKLTKIWNIAYNIVEDYYGS